jgi:hypothetical protein
MGVGFTLMATASLASAATLRVDDTTAQVGGVARVAVNLDNPEDGVRALQFSLGALPAGVEFVGAEGSGRAAGLTADAQRQPDGTVKVVLISLGEQAVAAGTGPVLDLHFVVHDTGSTSVALTPMEVRVAGTTGALDATGEGGQLHVEGESAAAASGGGCALDPTRSGQPLWLGLAFAAAWLIARSIQRVPMRVLGGWPAHQRSPFPSCPQSLSGHPGGEVGMHSRRRMRVTKEVNLVAVAVIAALASGAGAAGSPEAICVPWQPSNPSIAHNTYSGAATTLKGIARGPATDYQWNFGDGPPVTPWTAITDPYNLGVAHTYAGVVGQLFFAELHVRDASGNLGQSCTYPVQIYESSDLGIPEHLDVRINMAVDEGLWWLQTHMLRATYAAGSPGYEQPYGYWDPSYYPLGATCTAVDAFQQHGSKPNTDYDRDPYVETVQRALNYLLYNTYAFAIGPQPAGNPDVEPNGIGLVANQSASPTDTRQTYLGGICMIALASSDVPNRPAAVGGANVYGRTYSKIVQDMVDFFAWGQVDSGSGRGGWRYYANYAQSDMSTTQWPPLGMLAAEQNMGSTVPQFVRDEVIYFLDAMQNNALNNDNGAFAYGGYPHQILYNITKAAAGIIAHEFRGTPLTDPKVQKTIGYIYRHWNDTGNSWDDTRLHGNSYGMYGVMKAFRFPQPDITNVTEYDYNIGQQTGNRFDWYYTPTGQAQEGLASYIVRTQQADGSWDDVVGENPVYDAFATGWRLLTLLPGVTIPTPEAVICDCEKQEYNLNQDISLDGSCSFHPDRTRRIVRYEWDLDDDGVFDDAVGVEATIPGGFDQVGLYPVKLRVLDDNPANLGGPQSDTYVCQVNVHEPPHCPHAFAHPTPEGRYIGFIDVPLPLDASRSWDPDNEIVKYEWDLDNDGLFGQDDHDCFGEASDAVGISPQWTWHAPYSGVIGLKVTDAAGEFPSCSDIGYSSVEIGNHAPDSNPGGLYLALPNSTIPLDGTGSSDPDPGDDITFAWDLDNDGEFDDSTSAQPDFTVGSVVGMVYDICLKVTDSFGKYDIACTTVEVVSAVLRVGNANIPRGGLRAPIPIFLDNGVNVRGLQFVLTDVPDEVTLSPTPPARCATTARSSGLSCDCEQTGNTIVCVLISTGAARIAPGSGQVMTVFVDDTAPSCTAGEIIQLTLSDTAIADDNNNPLPHTTVNGSLRCGCPEDLNCDGRVDIFDALICVDVVLGRNPTRCADSDLDCSGSTNIFDCLIIVDTILGRRQPCSAPPCTAGTPTPTATPTSTRTPTPTATATPLLEDVLMPQAVILARGTVPGATVNLTAILNDASIGAQHIGDYAVWQKSLSAFDSHPTQGTHVTDPFPQTVQLTFALSAAGSFYFGAEGALPDVLSVVGSMYQDESFGVWDALMTAGWSQDEGIYEPRDIGLVGMGWRELRSLQTKGQVSGLPGDTYGFLTGASIRVKHKFPKPLSAIHYRITVMRGNGMANYPINRQWSQFASVYDNGTATRSVSLSYQGALGTYTYAIVDNNNGEQSWVTLDGTEITHQYNWGRHVKKLYNRYPASVGLGAIKTWSHINSVMTMTVVADSVNLSGWTENPSLGQRRNPSPDLLVLQPNVWTP